MRDSLTQDLSQQDASLADLQAINRSFSRVVTKFNAQFPPTLKSLEQTSGDLHQKTSHANTSFLQSCTTFVNDGSYHDEEVSMFTDKVKVLAEKSDEIRTRQEKQISELQRWFEEAKSGSDFSLLFAQRVEDVSVENGLGVRFGAPKRSLAAKIREELLRSDQQEKEIASALDLLKALLSPNAPKWTPGAVSAVDEEIPEVEPALMVRVVNALKCLRVQFFKRSQYFSVLRSDYFKLPTVRSEPYPGVHPLSGEYEAIEAPAQLLAPVGEEALDTCKNEMNALCQAHYEAHKERLADLIASREKDELPKALQVFLDSERASFAVRVATSKREFRHQMMALTEALKAIPRVAISDVLQRCSKELGAELRSVEETLSAQLGNNDADFEATVEQARENLQATASAPSELVAQEDERQQKELAALEGFRDSCNKATSSATQMFYEHLGHARGALFALFDTIVFEEDIELGVEVTVRERSSFAELVAKHDLQQKQDDAARQALQGADATRSRLPLAEFDSVFPKIETEKSGESSADSGAEHTINTFSLREDGEIEKSAQSLPELSADTRPPSASASGKKKKKDAKSSSPAPAPALSKPNGQVMAFDKPWNHSLSSESKVACDAFHKTSREALQRVGDLLKHHLGERAKRAAIWEEFRSKLVGDG